jgi:selenocysteine lyase/cysteine desulfurase
MIYLDHAATSFPKPPPVLDAIHRWFEQSGVSAGRGDSQLCRDVDAIVIACRRRLASWCGVPPQRLVFTSGATESLNRFLAGTLQPGDRVLTTALEHSSLVRPLVHLRETLGIEVEVLQPDPDTRIPAERFAAALARDRFRLVAFSHASNVVGCVLDASAICRVARSHGALSLLDASQSAGLLDLAVGADAVVGSAHKSLLAPPGLGFMAVGEDVVLRADRWGGTGSSTALDRQPEEWPTAFEPGTPNTPAIVGLAAALEYLDAETPAAILARELELIDQLRAGLGDHAEFYGPDSGPRIPIASFNVDGLDPAEAGLLLDAAGVHVRTGFHCAPWIHARLGAVGGTVRVSVGPFNRPDDIRRVTTALTGG